MIEWREVEGFEGLYMISSDGRVMSYQPRWLKPRFLKQQFDKDGYRTVHLRDAQGKGYCRRVHRLVALAFIGPIPTGKIVNHKDLDKANNNDWNLEYITNAENMAHAARAGLFKGENNAACRLTETEVKRIRAEYIFGSKHAGTRALARRFGMSQYAIHRIVSHRNWQHI